MTRFRLFLVAATGALALVGAPGVPAGADEYQGAVTLVQFDSMTPITGSAVGVLNDRKILAGGLPWAITSGTGTVTTDGHVFVRVTGLVLPAVNNTTGPIHFYSATVSCLTPSGVVNVTTGLFPTTETGNSTINATVPLPATCDSPEVFVGTTKPTGQFIFFATSNPEQEDQNQNN